MEANKKKKIETRSELALVDFNEDPVLQLDVVFSEEEDIH